MAFFIAEASAMIAPLDDAVYLGMATEEEETRLLAWKKYRVLLSRVNVTDKDIEWPEPPEKPVLTPT